MRISYWSSDVFSSDLWTLSGAINYDAELGVGWRLRPQADFAYRSAVNFDAFNTPSLLQPGYVVVNANVSLTDPSERWRLSVGVSNLTDKRYIVGGFSDLPASRSEEHTSELQSLMRISYAVFCLKKKNNQTHNNNPNNR